MYLDIFSLHAQVDHDSNSGISFGVVASTEHIKKKTWKTDDEVGKHENHVSHFCLATSFLSDFRLVDIGKLEKIRPFPFAPPLKMVIPRVI